VPTFVTNDVLYHIPERRILQDVVTCIRHGITVDELGDRREYGDRCLKPPEKPHPRADAGDRGALPRAGGKILPSSPYKSTAADTRGTFFADRCRRDAISCLDHRSTWSSGGQKMLHR
jgi:hypothetical protein